MERTEFIGGRGKKVGYETQMYRIPTPLKPTVEKLGLQFRLLWDGLTDPKGEKLISRIELAIPDKEQLAASNGANQISGKGEAVVFDIKNELAELRSRLADTEADRDQYQTSAEQWAAVAEHNLELLDSAKGELAEVRKQLADCQMDCKRLVVEKERLKADSERADEQLTLVRKQLTSSRALEKDATEQLAGEMSKSFKAADILKEALELKANTGGKIKNRIREALQLIDDL